MRGTDGQLMWSTQFDGNGLNDGDGFSLPTNVVADATGHGLPAALQVRDVFTGLRMGLAREFKLTRTVARLNQIIHRSRLATKFVTLFLAELNLEGRIIFCNAGHPAAIVMREDGSVSLLRSGGMILGPNPDARYTFGIENINPGDLLVLYTDGITEATGGVDGEEYGRERLIHTLRTAYRLLFADEGTLTERVNDVAEMFKDSEPVMEIIDFIRADTSRPICQPLTHSDD